MKKKGRESMKQTEKRKFGWRDKLGYALGDAGNDFTLMLLQSYLLVFYTKVLGVSGAVIGTMFLVTKFVDAFTDTAMGRIIDTHTDKNGDRFRPWIRRMAIPVVLASVLIYNIFIEDWPMWAKIAYVTVVYLIYGSVCYTGINIPYGAMAAVLTSDPKEKTSLSTFRSVGALLAGLVIGMVAPMVVFTKDASGNDVANGPRFLLLSIIFGGIALLCYYLCYHWSVERIHVPNKKVEKGDLWKSVKQVCSDRAIFSIILISICIFAATGVMQTLNQYLFLDYFKDTKMLTRTNLVMMGGMMLVAPFATKISVKFGKKEGSIVSLGIASAAYILLLVIRTTNPVVYIVAMFAAYLGLGFFTMVSWAMISDCIDNYYVEYGERADGTIYAMYSFLKKMAGAVTGSIGAWSLSWIGYDSLATVQTEAVSNAIYTVSVLIPVIFMIGTFLLIAFMYPLTRKKVEENARAMKALEAKENGGNSK